MSGQYFYDAMLVRNADFQYLPLVTYMIYILCQIDFLIKLFCVSLKHRICFLLLLKGNHSLGVLIKYLLGL